MSGEDVPEGAKSSTIRRPSHRGVDPQISSGFRRRHYFLGGHGYFWNIFCIALLTIC